MLKNANLIFVFWGLLPPAPPAVAPHSRRSLSHKKGVPNPFQITVTVPSREGNSSGSGGDLRVPHGLMSSFSFPFEKQPFFPVFCLLCLMLLDMSAGFDLFLSALQNCQLCNLETGLAE